MYLCIGATNSLLWLPPALSRGSRLSVTCFSGLSLRALGSLAHGTCHSRVACGPFPGASDILIIVKDLVHNQGQVTILYLQYTTEFLLFSSTSVSDSFQKGLRGGLAGLPYSQPAGHQSLLRGWTQPVIFWYCHLRLPFAALALMRIL